MRLVFACCVLALTALTAPLAMAQSGPLRIEITEGVIEPLPVAVPDFIPLNAQATQYGARIAQVVVADLVNSGLFREVPQSAYISQVTDFNTPLQYADWRAINAQAVITGAVGLSGGRLTVQFRLHDAVSGQVMAGLQFRSTQEGWRRMAHKVADAVYAQLTGEGGYFDSRVVFVSETGPKGDRRKRLAIMDYDGENVQYLTGSDDIVLAPRFSPNGDRVLYTSYETGFPRVYLLDVTTASRRPLEQADGTMSFAPRFAPDGRTVVFSLTRAGNTDLYRMNVSGSGLERLTSSPSIETAPSFSPDGRQIVFESDRSGSQQLYVMNADGSDVRRISFGQGRYGTPVWSPRGDLIAFTKQNRGRFHIGVMRTDGSEERLLTASFLDEGPTWSPNGRVIMFTRETQGANGRAALYSVDITGRNLRPVRTPDGASDAAWSPLQK
ncbi:MAG: Tol-Pal system protein TolB [Rhodobacteraceae bacterium]|nr:Tol-Pal system protein TolB [Paracoccaceae bacterium]